MLSTTVVAVFVVVLCLGVPIWFAASGASYQKVSSHLRKPFVWIPSLLGTAIAVGNPEFRVIGVALVMPSVQLAILICAAKVFAFATGEPLQHVPVQWLYVRGKLKHALVDLMASIVAVSAPLYLMHLLIFGRSAD